MKKILLMVALMLLVASPVLASNAYLPTDGECLERDLAVHSRDNSEVVSCLPKADVDKANAEAAKFSSGKNMISVAIGQRLLVKTFFGVIEDVCPTWFSASCVIPKEKFVSWL